MVKAKKRQSNAAKNWNESFARSRSLKTISPYLLEAGIHIAFFTALFGLLTGIFSLATGIVGYVDVDIVKQNTQLLFLASAASQFTALVGTLIVFKIAMLAIGKIQKYRNFEQYSADVRKILAKG